MVTPAVRPNFVAAVQVQDPSAYTPSTTSGVPRGRAWAHAVAGHPQLPTLHAVAKPRGQRLLLLLLLVLGSSMGT